MGTAMMKTKRQSWAICLLAAPAGFAPAACLAQDHALTIHGQAGDVDRLESKDKALPAAVTRPSPHTLIQKSHDIDWGTGQFVLISSREKTGRKRTDAAGGADPTWHRSLALEAQLRQDIARGWRIAPNIRLERIKSGSTDPSLLSRKSKIYSAEMSLALDHQSTGRMSLTAFDNGGWSGTDIADFANRATNGEDRAKKGFRLNYDRPLASIGTSSTLGVSFEQSQTSGFDTDRSIRLSTRVNF